MRRCCRCVVEFYSLVGPRKCPAPLAYPARFAPSLTFRETAPADKGQLVSVACDSPACIVATETVFFLVMSLISSQASKRHHNGQVTSMACLCERTGTRTPKTTHEPASFETRRMTVMHLCRPASSSILTFPEIPAPLLPRTETHPIYESLSFKAFEVVRTDHT